MAMDDGCGQELVSAAAAETSVGLPSSHITNSLQEVVYMDGEVVRLGCVVGNDAWV